MGWSRSIEANRLRTQSTTHAARSGAAHQERDTGEQDGYGLKAREWELAVRFGLRELEVVGRGLTRRRWNLTEGGRCGLGGSDPGRDSQRRAETRLRRPGRGMRRTSVIRRRDPGGRLS